MKKTVSELDICTEAFNLTTSERSSVEKLYAFS